MTVLGGIDRRLLQNVDWPLLGAMGGLVVLSATTRASLHIGRAGGNVAFRQLAWFVLGLCALVVVASIDYRRLVRLAPLFFVLGLLGLASVFVMGRTVSGARRWILLGPMSVQPSEIFKICFVLMATWVLTSRWAQPVGKTTLALTVPLVGVVALAGLAALPLVWFLAMKEYQRERILVFLDPFRDPLGSAYNVIQAKIAIGSGQLLGKGVAGATQSRLAFLPERHTDFIFAVFAETWGFVGCLVLLTCYALLLLRGFDIAASAREPVGRLIALGVTALFATQVLVNVGMVVGLLPVVGVPLPLMSYGGTSMLVSLTGLGLLLSVRMRQFQ